MSHKHDRIFHHSNWERLLSEDRYSFMPPESLLSSLSLNKNQVWADIGCGPGFFTLPLAQQVQKVFAIDISREMLDILTQRLKQHNISNVELIRSDCLLQNNLPLLDGILLVNVLHEFDDPDKCLNSYYKQLQKEGILVVVDWKAREMEMGPPVDHRIPEDKAAEIFERNGFNVIRSLDIYRYHYVILFRR